MTAVSLHKVSKTYNQSLKALNNVSIDVNENEIYGIIGPDGAGKTTLFRILITLLLPDTGIIRLFGRDVIKEYKKLRHIIGYMPGKFSLYQDLSVEENLNFFATVFGTTVQENYHLIKDIYQQIEPFKTRLAGQLSGGMKQKLALSCALIHKPKLLVLDEPTTGVDAVSRKEFWDMLLRLKQQGITILVSTPYMDEASLCDRIALIQKGEIMSTDTPEAVRKGFERILWAVRAQNMGKLLQDIKQWEGCHSAFLFGQDIHITLREGFNKQNELHQYLENQGHQNITIQPIEAGIEDCFMEQMISQENA